MDRWNAKKKIVPYGIEKNRGVGIMDNEQDYIELYRLLAKCKFSLHRELAKLNPNVIGYSEIIEYNEMKLKQVNDLMVDVPIIIKGDEF